MGNIIIGTAGHIDHGKTSLIRALTGKETDCLKEERERGVTIDIGFAHFNLPNGKKAGIIDVPGHEKFIKNMLAGVGGIDLVLLVIASDEGIMPQTREHLDILSILKIKQVIIVLTKKDKVEQEWLDMVEEEVREEIKGTSFADMPIIAVSSTTGEGLELLKEEIVKMTLNTERKNINVPVRLPIDRVFSADGFGTIVTGTQLEGTLNVGDEVSIYPLRLDSKIRNIQVHGEAVKSAFAGQRVAVNLQNMDKSLLKRGDILAGKDSLEVSMMIDVKIDLLESSNRELLNRTRVRLYHGTSETLCRVVLLDRESLKAGESGYAQLRLEEKIAVRNDDYFVLRFYSPMETIGGGIILDCNPVKHKRFKEDLIENLEIRSAGTFKDVLELVIKSYNTKLETLDFIVNQFGKEKEVVDEAVRTLIQENKIVALSKEIFVHSSVLERYKEKLIDLLDGYHEKYSLKIGMGKEELRSRLFGDQVKWTDLFLAYFNDENLIEITGKMVALSGFKVQYSNRQLKIKEEIEKIYLQTSFKVPFIEDLLKTFDDEEEALTIIQGLIAERVLVKIDYSICLHYLNYEKALELLKKFISENDAIVIGDFRDLLGTSRKYALPILEYFDKEKITRKIDDTRVLV